MDIKKRILENLTETQKYTLLLLSANNYEPVKGKLWFQKELFLLANNSEELEQLEFAKVVKNEGNKLKLTGLGRNIAEILGKNTSEDETEMIEDFKAELNDLTEDELLGFIYYTYPEMTKESIKIQKIKPKRKNIALSLYAKSKISLGKALEIAEMNIDNFILEAKLKGIQVYT